MRQTIRRPLGKLLYTVAAVLMVAGVAFFGAHDARRANAAGVADEIHYTITGPTSVTFDWRGDPTTIAYGATSNYGQTATAGGPVVVKENGTNVAIAPISGSGPWREARLAGLQPGTVYHYSIGGSPDQVFHTAPVSGSAGFSVVAEGDIGNPQDFTSTQAIQNLAAAQSPDVVIGVGDYPYANGTPTDGSVDAFFGSALLGANNGVEAWSLRTPFEPGWGNHEIDHANDNGTCTGDNLSDYKGRFDFANPKEDPIYATYCNTGGGEDWHWFDYGNTRFIAFPEPWADDWKTWNTKADAVMADAQANSNIKFIVTFGHRPAWSSGYHAGETALANYTAALHAKYSKFVLQLNGHSHDYERTDPASTGGVTYITSGGGGGYLENGSCSNGWNSVSGSCNKPSWSVSRLMHYGVLKLTFSSTGIAGQYICGPNGGETVVDACTPGSVADSFTIGSVTAPPPDTTPPVASITTPVTSATVNGIVTVSANATDASGIKQVEFFDGTTSLGVDTVAPYSMSWDTTKVANGTHTLTAVATDASSNLNKSTSGAVTVTVSNGCTALPTAYGSATSQVTVATAGTYHVWTRMMVPDTTNNSYYFQLGNNCGVVVGDAASIAPNTWVWVDYKDGNTATKNDVSLATTGTQTMILTGREPGVRVDRVLLLSDTCVPTGTGDNCVNPPDTTPPTNVVITAPTAGSSVKGQVTVTATASDNIGVSKVDFYDGTTLIGTSTTPASGTTAGGTWQLIWNTSNVAIGSHTLTVKVSDGVNTTASSPVTVTVPDTTPPAVSILSPANNSAVQGLVNVTASAQSSNTLTKAELYVNNQLASTVTSALSPYSFSWDATKLSAGSYVLTVKVYDNSQPALVGVSSPVTVTVPDTTAPSAPTNLNTTLSSTPQVNLTWVGSTDNVGVRGYQVLRGGAPIANVIGTTYSDVNVAYNTSYTYSIAAFDAAGNLSTPSNQVTITTPQPVDSTPPSTPTSLSAVASSATQVNLIWVASTDNVGVAKYVVQRISAGTQIIVGETATIGFTDNTVLPGASYSYVVYAVDAATNVSAASNTASATTPALPDTTPPTVPQDLAALNVSYAQINVLWQPSTDNVGVAGYDVLRNGVKVATVTGTSYGDGLISPNTVYTYSVVAFDAVGNRATPAATTITSLPASSGHNYVLNPGFENDFKGWRQLESKTAVKLSRTSSAHSGFYAAHLARLSGTNEMTLNDSPDWLARVPAGAQTCTAMAWVQSSVAGKRLVIRLRDYQGNKNVGYYTSDMYAPDTNWHLLTVSAPVLSSRDDLDLNVYGKDFSSGQAFSIDDVQETCL
ncbi:MAG TPA: Ig-like domain-containing protein [Patescibacteria group bacterium]|nr:Ig-like domain-containing protein [Patescibacteria group bacterium]